MKRAAGIVVLLLIVSSLSAAPPEKWWEAYKRGVSAVNARNYRGAAEALQKSIAEMPNEGLSVRAGKELIVYVPHFWLGIAKFNLGDVDGSLREWRISEDQGVIAKTEYYSRMKDWVARAQAEKQRTAQSEASGPKKEADTAISRALAMQVDALSAGGDRSESYRAAQRKLQEALSQFHKAGTDVSGYKAAEQTAQQAISLFSAAAEEGKKLKAARATPPTPKPQPVRTQPVVVQPPPAQTQTAAPVVVKTETAPPPPPVESEAEVAARLAVQQYRRNVGEAPRSVARVESGEAESLRQQLELARTDADFERIRRTAQDRDAAMAGRIAELSTPSSAPLTATAEVLASAIPSAALPDLRSAYRAFASGDLVGSESLLTRMLAAKPKSAEAYLLRGCARYTRAMLSRTPAPLLEQATSDFKSALKQNRDLRLDRRTFSPKLVAFFEEVRVGR